MKDLIICRCEEVCLSNILEAIDEGANSIPGIKKRVRIGMGHCQGRVCQPIVYDIIASQIGNESKPMLQRAQAPVRPTKLSDIIKK